MMIGRASWCKVLVCIVAIIAASTIQMTTGSRLHRLSSSAQSGSQLSAGDPKTIDQLLHGNDWEVTKKEGKPTGGFNADVWKLREERGVKNHPCGTTIGNIGANTEIGVEAYRYIQRADKTALYGWGFVKSQTTGYGGWTGQNSCGWFPLQTIRGSRREFGEQIGSLTPAQSPIRCAPAPANAFQANSYSVKTKQLSAAVTNKQCQAYLNYDPILGDPADAVADVNSGVSSGVDPSVIGKAPVDIPITLSLPGFGVKYITKDGKFASIHYPSLLPSSKGYHYFFIDATCLEIDTLSLSTANAPSATIFLQSDSSTHLVDAVVTADAIEDSVETDELVSEAFGQQLEEEMDQDVMDAMQTEGQLENEDKSLEELLQQTEAVEV